MASRISSKKAEIMTLSDSDDDLIFNKAKPLPKSRKRNFESKTSKVVKKSVKKPIKTIVESSDDDEQFNSCKFM